MASNVQSKLLLEAAQQYAQAISPEALAVLEMMLKDAKKHPVINEKEFFKNDNSK